MKEFRLLFTASRHLTDRDRPLVIRALSTTLGKYDEDRQCRLIHGDGRGGDSVAKKLWREWVATWPDRFLRDKPYPADWEKHGKAAGPLRNSEMVAAGADACATIAARDSVGTFDCAHKARAAGIPTEDFGEPTDLARVATRRKAG